MIYSNEVVSQTHKQPGLITLLYPTLYSTQLYNSDSNNCVGCVGVMQYLLTEQQGVLEGGLLGRHINIEHLDNFRVFLWVKKNTFTVDSRKIFSLISLSF